MFLFKQSFNAHGVAHLVTAFRNPKLLLPDYYCNLQDVPDHIKAVNNDAVASAKPVCIEALVFDKDNTLTIPFNNIHYGAREEEHAKIAGVISRCQDQFGFDNVAILSNSAGSCDDVDALGAFPHADKVEQALSIRVLRHGSKKPACATKVYDYFYREGEKTVPTRDGHVQMPSLCIVGDRLLTDILFGNMHGCTTVLVDPIDKSKDIPVVRLVRFIEMEIVIPLICRHYRLPLPHKVVLR